MDHICQIILFKYVYYFVLSNNTHQLVCGSQKSIMNVN